VAFRAKGKGAITRGNERSITYKQDKIMGKGNNSQKNDKKSKKPKQDKAKPTKAGGKK
jgi:hypothetical protein